MFTWGLGLAGRLGHGSEEPEFSPRSVDELKGKSVIQVTSGGGHSAALTLNGMVYTFGYGVRGQLGHGKDVITQWTPRLVEALCRCWVVKVTAACDRTVVLTKDGRVLHFGAALPGVERDNAYLPTEAPRSPWREAAAAAAVVDVATSAFRLAALVMVR